MEKHLAPSVALPVYYDHPDAFRAMGSLFGADGDGCSTCGVLGILGVLSDGTYALCGIGTTVSELVLATYPGTGWQRSGKRRRSCSKSGRDCPGGLKESVVTA